MCVYMYIHTYNVNCKKDHLQKKQVLGRQANIKSKRNGMLFECNQK